MLLRTRTRASNNRLNRVKKTRRGQRLSVFCHVGFTHRLRDSRIGIPSQNTRDDRNWMRHLVLLSSSGARVQRDENTLVRRSGAHSKGWKDCH